MKHLALSLLLALAAPLRAQESKDKTPAPSAGADSSASDITGLRQAAADFVIAYNSRDAKALAALFTEAGEMSDINGEELTSGRADIQAHYEQAFRAADAPSVAVEVDSVRLVAPDLAIEDGTVHFTPPGDDKPARSATYTAVLRKTEKGAWQIASTRTLTDATDAAGQLADLADSIKGDWTSQKGDTRMDLAVGWDDSGKYLAGKLLITKPDAKPMTTTVRVGWDAARQTITAWMFDDAGGFSKADWTPAGDGWQIRAEGTTADGEATSATQRILFDGKDAFTWSSRDRLVSGESLPDNELRVVRQAPEPAAE
jgi:uncharacterized protein (TIGR02246 family)